MLQERITKTFPADTTCVLQIYIVRRNVPKKQAIQIEIDLRVKIKRQNRESVVLPQAESNHG